MEVHFIIVASDNVTHNVKDFMLQYLDSASVVQSLNSVCERVRACMIHLFLEYETQINQCLTLGHMIEDLCYF
jgi:hypothetical protein